MRRIAVIGGGVTGCSVAWHLADREAGEVHLFERDQLGSGTTWHSAGNVTWKPAGDDDAPVRYLLDLVRNLEAETGLTSGWRATGRLFLARDGATLETFRPYHDEARARGLESRMLSAREAAGQHPLLDASPLAGAWLNPVSGHLNPADLVAVLARSAKGRGVRLHEMTRIDGLASAGGRVSGVRVGGEVHPFDDVVVAAGLWSAGLAAAEGAALAQGGCQHFYIILDIEPRLAAGTPSFISTADLIYGREEVGGLLLGCFDEEALTIDVAGLPDPFAFSLLNENWDKFMPYFEPAAELFPALLEAPARRFVNGPEAFTPDGKPLIGAAPGVEGLWLATGMNSYGVTISAAAGHLIADLVTGAEPRFPAAAYAPERFGDAARDPRWLHRRLADAPSLFYRGANPHA